jgi:4-aminobutyrate aminotransferase-like enzyme
MWASEQYGLEPDIMTGGKGLSGGVGSLAVVMASDEIVESFYAGTTPTSGGNAVSAAAGAALLQAIEDEGILENCRKMGEYFTKAVLELDDPWIGDVRFSGLLGGVELVTDRESKEILPFAACAALKDRLHADGMLLTISGMHKNVLRLQPPLTITAAQLDTFVESLRKNLRLVRTNS